MTDKWERVVSILSYLCHDSSQSNAFAAVRNLKMQPQRLESEMHTSKDVLQTMFPKWNILISKRCEENSDPVSFQLEESE